MIPLCITSVIGLMAILYNFLSLSRSRVIPDELSRKVENFESIIAGDRVAPLLLEFQRGESALACYTQINTVEPYLQQAKKLRIARLKILQGKEKIEPLLNELNQLQINRSLNTEPVHLEAAYDYAKYHSRGDPKRLLKLLGAAKEAFTSQKDIPAKEYHALRGTNQRLDYVYQAYLMLFDARIAQTEGDLAKRKDPVEASRKYAIAKELYETLLSEKFAISKYLVDQAQSSLLTLQGNT